ncbi:MAG: type II secretion system minor pseudopilin GspK [Nitrospirae bacterium]|nr:type II secretion system minor pseudopilin GspK [Nitrospirota bacterium]
MSYGDFQLNNKGIALIITLLVLTLLLTMILEFSMDMRVEARAAANFRDEVQAYYLARSGVTFAIAVLEEDLSEDSKNEDKTDTLNELWAKKIPPVPVGSGTVTVAITDEDSKININKLDKGNPPVTGANMRALMTNFLKQFELKEGLKEEIPDAIADFIDDNSDEISFNSAESSYYEGLEEHYTAKNKPLYSLQELRMIKGIDGALFNKINKFLTVNSDGKLNINTVSKEVLLSLPGELSEDVVDEIIAFRAETPFQKNIELRDHIQDPEVFNNISRYIDVRSNFFSITSTGNVNNSRKTITAIVNRKEKNSEILYWRID